MGILYTTSSILFAAIVVGALFLMNRAGKETTLIRRCLAIALVFIAFYRYMSEHEAVYFVRGLNMYSPFGNEMGLTVFAILLVWFTYAALLMTLLDQFFDFRTLRNLTRYFGVPVLLADLAAFNVYATAIVGADPYGEFDVRVVLIAAEIAIALGLVVSKALFGSFSLFKTSPLDGVRAELPGRQDWKSFFFALPFALLTIIPCYVPQALLGYADVGVHIFDLTEEHRIVLYFGIIIPFLIFHALKDKPYETRRFCMIFMSLGLMWSYISYWTLPDLADPLNLPLHLCNTAMFLIPLCLTLKLDRLFYFCLFINVLGAFLAMLMPNTAENVNAFATNRVNFWINHYPAFFTPVLLIALKIFKRPKFKEWKFSLGVFTIYFVAMLIINAWFSNYGDVDYFFLNSDFIVDKLGKWARDTRNFTITFNIKDLTFTFYPLYQVLFYLVYVAVTAGMWFLYALLFKVWDAAEDRRLRERDYKRMKKDLKDFLGGRAESEPVSGDSSPCIELKEFSKKYGANTHYSVDHATFKVQSGEVFGFLGPNGAGKSTIIKSMVGIQTITSGNIEICGYDVERQPVMAKLNTGFVPDHYALYENLTGREYINYIADLYNVTKEERDETIESLVDRFQLKGAFDNQMKTYSHGMKQKIAIMAALVHNPKVWILDEPLTGLDPTSIHEVKECMKAHAAKGNIVFFSSHIIDVVEKICDKIAIIKKGKIRAAARVSELEARNIDLEQFYLDTIYAEEDAAVVSIDGDDILCLNTSSEAGGGEV